MITQAVKLEYAPVSFLEPESGRRLAYALTEGDGPSIVFLGGFRSDMTGTKATAFEDFCGKEGRRFLRCDYTGHGQSSGDFRQGTIGRWKRDALDILNGLTEGPVILVGSSMGAWIALLAALENPEKVAGLVGIASAPDFTERLVWDKLTFRQKKKLMDSGSFELPDCYGGAPYPITRGLIEDGRQHLLLGSDHELPIPVRLLHGTEDQDVPWRTSFELMERLKSPDISLELVKDGDHRLSYPGHLAALFRALDEVLSRV